MTNGSGELIGIVGVGRMGLAIAKHLMRHHYGVIAQDIEPKAMEAARAAGARTAATPAAVGKEAGFVIVAVGYDDEAAAVMLDEGGLLESMRPGSVISVSSTCTPDHVKMLAARAAAKSVDLLDAPICRGQRAADEGTMLSLCGGKLATFERALPILKTYSADVVHLGDVGAGQFGKALNNFLLWVNGIALIEAGRLSEANGMDLVKLRDTLLISSGASDALKNWDNVSFTWALKDMQIVSKMADKPALALPLPRPTNTLTNHGLRSKHTNPPDWTGRNKR